MNFKTDSFKGSLSELIENYIIQLVPKKELLHSYAKWIEDQENFFPIRKHRHHPLRGQVFDCSDKVFVPVDNELLAFLYKELLKGKEQIASLEDLINKKVAPVSRHIDHDPSKNLFRTAQINSTWRDAGYKLTHLEDAAKGLSQAKVVGDYFIRYLRALHPYNVILFPSSRAVHFTLNDQHLDAGEDQRVKLILQKFLASHLGIKEYNRFLELLQLPIINDSNWSEEAKSVLIASTPKGKKCCVFGYE